MCTIRKHRVLGGWGWGGGAVGACLAEQILHYRGWCQGTAGWSSAPGILWLTPWTCSHNGLQAKKNNIDGKGDQGAP